MSGLGSGGSDGCVRLLSFSETCVGDDEGLISIRETNRLGYVLPDLHTTAEICFTPYSFSVTYYDTWTTPLLTCDYLLTPLAKLQAARMIRDHMKILFIDRSRINPSINTLNDVGCTWIEKSDWASMLRLQTSFDMTEAELLSAFEDAKAWRPSDETLLAIWGSLTMHHKADYVLELHRFEEQFGESLFTEELVEHIGPQWMQFAN